MFSKLSLIVTSVLLTLAAAMPEPHTARAAAQFTVDVPLAQLVGALGPLGALITGPITLHGTVVAATDGSVDIGDSVDVDIL
ncbi:hypothetical protein C8R43DRAFT_1124495 [Mycena crocata]|nr:hypothetical protein C8R43DRAFT_1124495 [Mycena crocata]